MTAAVTAALRFVLAAALLVLLPVAPAATRTRRARKSLRPVMPGDPSVRADGRCARRGCTAERLPERSVRYGKQAATFDPFCSTECCKAYYAARANAACP